MRIEIKHIVPKKLITVSVLSGFAGLLAATVLSCGSGSNSTRDTTQSADDQDQAVVPVEDSSSSFECDNKIHFSILSPVKIELDQKSEVCTTGEVILVFHNRSDGAVKHFWIKEDEILVRIKGVNDEENPVGPAFKKEQDPLSLGPKDVVKAKVDIQKGMIKRLNLETGVYLVQFHWPYSNTPIGSPVEIRFTASDNDNL